MAQELGTIPSLMMGKAREKAMASHWEDALKNTKRMGIQGRGRSCGCHPTPGMGGAMGRCAGAVVRSLQRHEHEGVQDEQEASKVPEAGGRPLLPMPG